MKSNSATYGVDFLRSTDHLNVDLSLCGCGCSCSTCRALDGQMNFKDNSSLDYRDLIWDYQILDRNIGYSETVDYSLFNGSWELSNTFDHRGNELGVFRYTQEQQDFITSIFERLGRIIDLEFNQVEKT